MSRNSHGPRGAASGPASSQAGGSAAGSSAPPPGWQALLTDKGVERLAGVEADLARGATEFELGSRLRSRGVPSDEAAALLGQADLRRKAATKFGDAARELLFTPAGLEQASRRAAAQLHARRFADAGCRRVADLGCGIGAESIAMLAAGVDVLAVEIDPFTAQIAEHNLAVTAALLRRPAPQVVVADAERFTGSNDAALDEIDGVFLDPARRTAGHRDTRRLASPDDYSPGLGFAFGLAERFTTGVKLGPGLDRELIPSEAEAQWVSIDGAVIEVGLWFGAAARAGVKRAALVVRGEEHHELTAREDAPDAEVRGLGEYLYEPDGAVIRARLIGDLARGLNAGHLSEGIAYLSSDSLVPTPFAQAFRVTEELPMNEKQLRRALAERKIGSLEIKKRGADLDPAALRTRLRLRGPNRATLVLTRVHGRHTALLAERVAQA